MPSSLKRPRVYIIAGANGAGKTTFANEYLPQHYKALADYWQILDNTTPAVDLIAEGSNDLCRIVNAGLFKKIDVS
jgi:predicted ABC-type ATPase